MSCKKYFTNSNVKRSNSKKSILHLSVFSNATVVKCNFKDATVVKCPDVKLRYTPRPLKEIAFIIASPTIYEIDFEVRERSYLTNYYKFSASNMFSLADILDEYMTENYSTEYWEIIENFPYVNLCCSCQIRIDLIGRKKKVFVNKYFYSFQQIGSIEKQYDFWFKSFLRQHENEDFTRMICYAPDRKLLNDMLLRQLHNFCTMQNIS